MVSDSSVDCGARSISSPVRSAIRSIKEVVEDRSDADIVAVLAETHMDPNEAAQRLLAQGGTFTEHHTREQEEREREEGNMGRKWLQSSHEKCSSMRCSGISPNIQLVTEELEKKEACIDAMRTTISEAFPKPNRCWRP